MADQQAAKDPQLIEAVARALCLCHVRATATFDSRELERQYVESCWKNHVPDAKAALKTIVTAGFCIVQQGGRAVSVFGTSRPETKA